MAGEADSSQAGRTTQNGGGAHKLGGAAGLIADSPANGQRMKKSAGNGQKMMEIGGKSAPDDVARVARARDSDGRLLLRPGQICVGGKLDDELEQRICGYIAEGLTITDACGLCDISRETLHRWKERGVDEPGSRYAQFLEKCEKAELSCKRVWVKRIAADLDWRAVAWLAARRWPASFTEYTRQELSGPDGVPLPSGNPFNVVVHVGPTPEGETFSVIDHRVPPAELNGQSQSTPLPDPWESGEAPNPAEPIAPDEPSPQPVSIYDPLGSRAMMNDGFHKPKIRAGDVSARKARDLKMRDQG